MALTIMHGKRNRQNFKGATYHITTRCNNKLHLIKERLALKKYLSILRKFKKKYGFLLHNYSTVNSHVHLILRLKEFLNISKIMHSINRCYAHWYNKHYDRTGHFWEERFYGKLITDDLQLLTTMIYMDLNSVKAKLCNHPADWEFSGARCYLRGTPDKLIDYPDVYLNLGENIDSRQKTYARIMNPYYARIKNSTTN